MGERGLTIDDKKRIVEHLARYGTVCISSEAPLPPDLQSRALCCPVRDVHHVIHFASMVVGESATMASEAAMLGTPALYIAHTLRGYTIDQEKRYGLVKNINPRRMDEVLSAITARAEDENVDEWARHQRKKLLAERIDVTGFLDEQVMGYLRGASCAA
jgi:predicted glycosyltransferase